MADINVERKKPSVWPWVVGLVVLALLIWLAVEMFGGDRAVRTTGADPDTATFGAPANSGPAGAPAPAPPVMTPAGPDTFGAIPDTAFP